VALYKRSTFVRIRLFAPISLIASPANILVFNPQLPWRTMAELIAALARPSPARSISSSPWRGRASSRDELSIRRAKIYNRVIPYKARRRRCRTDRGPLQIMFCDRGVVFAPHIR